MIRISAFADEISQDPVEQIDVLTRHGIKAIEFRAIHGTNVLDLADASMPSSAIARRERNPASARSARRSARSGSPSRSRSTSTVSSGPWAWPNSTGPPQPGLQLLHAPGDDPAGHREEVIDGMAELSRHGCARESRMFLENEKGIYGDTAGRVADILENRRFPGPAARLRPGQRCRGPEPIDEGRGAALVADFTSRYDAKLRPTGGPARVTALPASCRRRPTRLRASRVLEPHLTVAGLEFRFTGPERFAEAVAALKAIVDERKIADRDKASQAIIGRWWSRRPQPLALIGRRQSAPTAPQAVISSVLAQQTPQTSSAREPSSRGKASSEG